MPDSLLFPRAGSSGCPLSRLPCPESLVQEALDWLEAEPGLRYLEAASGQWAVRPQALLPFLESCRTLPLGPFRTPPVEPGRSSSRMCGPTAGLRPWYWLHPC